MIDHKLRVTPYSEIIVDLFKREGAHVFWGSHIVGVRTSTTLNSSLKKDSSVYNSHVSDLFNGCLSITSFNPFLQLLIEKYARSCPFMTALVQISLSIHLIILPSSTSFPRSHFCRKCLSDCWLSLLFRARGNKDITFQ